MLQVCQGRVVDISPRGSTGARKQFSDSLRLPLALATAGSKESMARRRTDPRTRGSGGRSVGVSPTALGVTLIGVILSTGMTVGFGVHGDWWVRFVAACATVFALGAAVKALTRGGHGALSRLAEWLVGGTGDDNPDRR
jgi:hypothetical protein